MEEFNIVRHGDKMKGGEERPPLEESGLTLLQQEKWKQAVESLGLDNPEITYDSLPKIEALAKDICSELPEKALLIFNSTNTPRTKLTADFLAVSVMEESRKQGKTISTAFIWEPSPLAQKEGSLTRTSEGIGTAAILKLMAEVESIEDKNLEAYLTTAKGGTAHPKEDELMMQAANKDLASADSLFKKRAPVLRDQVARIRELKLNGDGPVYFYGVGHHASLIALDVAFNNREKYSLVEEMPQPLNIWKVDTKKQTQEK